MRFILTIRSFFNALRKWVRGGDVLIVRQTKEHWDRQFAKGKWDFLTKASIDQGHAAIIGLLCRELAKESKIKVLDVGCGNGLVTGTVTTLCSACEYTGFDISQVALDKLKEQYGNVTLFCADANNPPDFKEKFDVILFAEVLLYLDFERILATYKQFLNEDGVYIISLYDSWRTKLIWMRANKHLHHVLDYQVKHKQKGVSWNIVVAKYQ